MANDVRITISGVEAAGERLGRLRGIAWALRPMQRAVYLLQNRMANYPAQRAGSSYVRTGTLGRLWTTKVESSATRVTGLVGNKLEYAPFVQSRQLQSRVHRGRWQTEMDVIERSEREIIGLFRAAIEEAVR